MNFFLNFRATVVAPARGEPKDQEDQEAASDLRDPLDWPERRETVEPRERLVLWDLLVLW